MVNKRTLGLVFKSVGMHSSPKVSLWLSRHVWLCCRTRKKTCADAERTQTHVSQLNSDLVSIPRQPNSGNSSHWDEYGPTLLDKRGGCKCPRPLTPCSYPRFKPPRRGWALFTVPQLYIVRHCISISLSGHCHVLALSNHYPHGASGSWHNRVQFHLFDFGVVMQDPSWWSFTRRSRFH